MADAPVGRTPGADSPGATRPTLLHRIAAALLEHDYPAAEWPDGPPGEGEMDTALGQATAVLAVLADGPVQLTTDRMSAIRERACRHYLPPGERLSNQAPPGTVEPGLVELEQLVSEDVPALLGEVLEIHAVAAVQADRIARLETEREQARSKRDTELGRLRGEAKQNRTLARAAERHRLYAEAAQAAAESTAARAQAAHARLKDRYARLKAEHHDVKADRDRWLDERNERADAYDRLITALAEHVVPGYIPGEDDPEYAVRQWLDAQGVSR